MKQGHISELPYYFSSDPQSQNTPLRDLRAIKVLFI